MMEDTSGKCPVTLKNCSEFYSAYMLAGDLFGHCPLKQGQLIKFSIYDEFMLCVVSYIVQYSCRILALWT